MGTCCVEMDRPNWLGGIVKNEEMSLFVGHRIKDTDPPILIDCCDLFATFEFGETIVLGGLIVGRTNKEKSGIPILMDIPVVGGLFSSNSKGQDRSELLVFIQPSVVGKDNQSLNALQLDMQDRFRVSDETLDFAKGRESAPKAKPVSDANPTERRKATTPRHRR